MDLLWGVHIQGDLCPVMTALLFLPGQLCPPWQAVMSPVLTPPHTTSSCNTEHCDHSPSAGDAGTVPAAWHNLALHAGPSWHVSLLCNPCTSAALWSGSSPAALHLWTLPGWSYPVWQGDIDLLRGGCGLCWGQPMGCRQMPGPFCSNPPWPPSVPLLLPHAQHRSRRPPLLSQPLPLAAASR